MKYMKQWWNKVIIKLTVNVCFWQAKTEELKRSLMPHIGVDIAKRMRRISCLSWQSLLPEIGQKARISISETMWLPVLIKMFGNRMVSIIANDCTPMLDEAYCMTPIAIFYFSLPKHRKVDFILSVPSPSPHLQYPASKVLSYFFSARHGEARESFAVKRRTPQAKSLDRNETLFCPTWLSHLSIGHWLFEGLPNFPIWDPYR